ncbi:hypothetical protein [Streptomyces sp. CB01201]|uniref:hypothetical protein n=1 Tax=Streptomyces sp. CB01201 TaxID=2020324 RepID=UPI0018FEA9DB|nr:hypothetical protein [Streptomyces sp. CB01201]
MTFEQAEHLLGADQADLEPFDFAEPAFTFGIGDAGDQVIADVGKPCRVGTGQVEGASI